MVEFCAIKVRHLRSRNKRAPRGLTPFVLLITVDLIQFLELQSSYGKGLLRVTDVTLLCRRSCDSS